jgi:hypothetical protein
MTGNVSFLGKPAMKYLRFDSIYMITEAKLWFKIPTTMVTLEGWEVGN